MPDPRCRPDGATPEKCGRDSLLGQQLPKPIARRAGWTRKHNHGEFESVAWQSLDKIGQMPFGAAIVEIGDAERNSSGQERLSRTSGDREWTRLCRREPYTLLPGNQFGDVAG